MPDRVISVPQATQIATRIKNKFDNVNGRLRAQQSEIDTLNDGGLILKDDVIAESVDGWLNDHPEATTTVQDGSLTEAKFTEALSLKTIKDYVTPEMYGAKGDGETDDTTAIQSALNSGKAVMLSKKTYVTSGKVTVPNSCPTITSLGTIKYTGNDYAIELVACRERTYDFGTIDAVAGGCILLDADKGYLQYLNIRFKQFKALTNCVYFRIPSNWINEIRFFDGIFGRGAYGLYAENTTPYFKNHYILSEIGFEGVTTAVHLSGLFHSVICYGCRMEESTTNLLTSNAETMNNENNFSWYGPLYMKFAKNNGHFPMYVWGPLYNLELVLFSTHGVIVDGKFYGELPMRQYYLTGWDTTEETPTKSITNYDMQTKGNMFRFATVDVDKPCVIEIDKSAFYYSQKFNMPVYVFGNIRANQTLTIKTSDGIVLKTYAPTSDLWSKLLKIQYVGNYGIVVYEMPTITLINP